MPFFLVWFWVFILTPSCLQLHGQGFWALAPAAPQEWPYDPDLPENVPDGALPANWNATADYSPADGAALWELLDGDGSGDATNGSDGDYTIISLDADVDYGEGLIHYSCHHILLRTDEYTSLPTFALEDFDARVDAADETYMATMSRVPSQPSHTVLSIRANGLAHTGSNDSATFTNSGSSWETDELVGKVISNNSNTCFGTITANTSDTITATLAQGSENDWDTGEIATISDHTEVAHHIRFIGIKFAFTGSYGSNVSGMVASQSAAGTSCGFTALPHHIIYDRCAFTTADEIECQTALQFDADDSAVIGCNLYNIFGAGNNGSTAIWVYNAHRILIHNNYIESQSTGTFFGDNVFGSIEDVEYTYNYNSRPTAWADTGTYGTAKAGGIETKTGNRILIEDSVFENHFATNWEMLSFKVDGTYNQNSTRNVTVRRVLIKETYWSWLVHVTGSTPNASAGPNTDYLFEDVLSYSAARACRVRFSTADDSRQLQRVQIRNCTVLGDVRSTGFGDGEGDLLVLKDNIFGGTLGYFDNESGAAGLNNGWDDSYDVQYNSFLGQSISAYDNDASPAPLGTLDNNQFPANIAAIGFSDEANDVYSLDAGSDLIDVSSVSGPLGYDSTTCDPIWAEVMGL